MSKFAVIGCPVSHSMSPFLHNEIFKRRGISASYSLRNIPPKVLETALPSLAAEFDGFNCTIPHKERIIPLLDYVSPEAKLIGSVNTVKSENGKTYGYSTDGEGVLKSLALHGIELTRKKVLILGSGGVARVIAFVCAEKGCTVTFAVRNPEKAKDLADELTEKFGIGADVVPLNGITGDYDILFQCTPVGMYPETNCCPVDDFTVSRCKAVFDTVYNPEKTLLVKKAENMGKVAVGGVEMLVFQGLASQRIWNGLEFSDAEAKELIRLVSEKLRRKNKGKSIVLIGFMASGKSTLGRVLASEMNCKFVDLDKKAEQISGRKIKDIFMADGEDYFRKLETEVLSRYSSAEKCVISTGGGIIKRSENIALLKENSFTVFLDVPFDVLAERAKGGNTRPLFRDVDKAYELWKEREPLYRDAADYVYSDHSEILLGGARKIKEAYYKFLKKEGE